MSGVVLTPECVRVNRMFLVRYTCGFSGTNLYCRDESQNADLQLAEPNKTQTTAIKCAKKINVPSTESDLLRLLLISDHTHSRLESHRNNS